MKANSRKAMFVKLKGKNVKLGRSIVINTGKTDKAKDRTVKLVEQHKMSPGKICVQYHGKKSLVAKKDVVRV